MLVSIIFIAVSFYFGFLLSFYFKSLDTFHKKIAFGIIIGLFFSTWTTYLISFILGELSFIPISITVLIFVTTSVILTKLNVKKIKKMKIKKINSKDYHYFIFVFVFIVWFLFFSLGLRTDSNGNMFCFNGFCSDAPFHMSIINSFIYRNNFPPTYSLYAGVKMAYPFLNDFLSSILIKGGFPLRESIVIPDIILIFSLISFVLFFIYEITKNKLVTSISMIIFFFGGIGFLNIVTVLLNFPLGPVHLNLDITNFNSVASVATYPYFNFAEITTNIFHPQRSYLMGFPIAMIILYFFYRNLERFDKKEIFFSGILLGLLPKFHVHSFIVVSFVYLFLLIYKRESKWLYFIIPAAILSFPQILSIISQPKGDYFFGFVMNDGFWKSDNPVTSPIINHLIFWIRVMGFPMILGWVGLLMTKKKNIIFFTPFFLLFILMNIVRFQPSFGDNNKITLFFLLFMSIFSAYPLSKIFNKNKISKILVILIVILSCFQFIFIFNQNIIKVQNYKYNNDLYNNGYPFLFNQIDFEVADWIIKNTPEESIFLTSDSNNQLVPSLTGRKIVKGVYAWNLGLRNGAVDNDIREIYQNGKCKSVLRQKVDYVFIGPDEKGIATFNFTNSSNFEKVFDLDKKSAKFEIYKTLC